MQLVDVTFCQLTFIQILYYTKKLSTYINENYIDFRSRMNCIVEKRRAEELVDHQPRNVRLPFGLNLTTDPRLERVTGERMAIFCESGNDQK